WPLESTRAVEMQRQRVNGAVAVGVRASRPYIGRRFGGHRVQECIGTALWGGVDAPGGPVPVQDSGDDEPAVGIAVVAHRPGVSRGNGCHVVEVGVWIVRVHRRPGPAVPMPDDVPVAVDSYGPRIGRGRSRSVLEI